jgi:hypothetical protein
LLLEAEMYERKVVNRKLGLVDTVEGRAAVYDMADGTVGRVPRVLRISLERAFADQKNPRKCLTWMDVAAGYRSWIRTQSNEDGGLPHKLFDPFDPKNKEGGPRWSTIKYVNLDFPQEQRVQRRKVERADAEVEPELVE